jgi:formylglycine-generating enzyme required for sulfatase activity
MPGVGELGHLTDAQYADLVERVDRFHEAWIPDEPANPASFLPSRSAPHRFAVLIELLKTDLELRAKVHLPVRIDPYLVAFPDDLPAHNVPVTLLLEEYLVRHRFADRPPLEEYKKRFPTVYDRLAAGLAQLAGKSAGANAGRPGAAPPKLDDGVAFNSTSELILSQTQVRDVPPVPPEAGPPGTMVEKIEPVLPDEDDDRRRKAKKAAKSKGASKSRSKSRSKTDLNEVPADTLPAELEYKLLRKLGQGTFGEVYEALAPGGFRVAVKKILRSMDHPASVGELESLEAIKTMTHPYLLQTQAYWVFRDRLIIVMELADGSLTDMIKDATGRGLMGVPADDLVTYFEQVAEAVDYLHSQNVSHRDIKPANLLHLKGYAKLADFGLARMHEHTQTTVGQEMGTPLFMAPEAWNKKISLHSDQYSLAATYVSARLGRNLYKAAAMHELAVQHMTGTPNLDPLEPAEQAVLLRALAKNPDDRYPNCKAFVKALRQATTPVPVPTAVDIDLERPRSRVGPLTVALALVLLVSVAGLVYVAVFSPGRAVVVTPPPTQPEKILALPGWAPNPDAGTLTLPDGRKMHKELTRTVAGTTLVAVAVPPARATDPPPFYMLRDKVTNRVFKAVWEAADKNDRSAVAEFRKRFGKDAKPLLPGMWREGALPQIGTPLGIEGQQLDVPVLNLTMPEASLVAAELGGSLPTYLQWQHAVEGPGGTLPDLLAKWKPKPGQTEPTEEELEHLGVALGLKFGPWPVTRVTPDVSVHGVRELISNGFEWTGVTIDGPLDLRSNPAVTPKVLVVGQGWDIPEVLTPAKIAGLKSEYSWDSAKTGIGFRVVFDPQ